MDKKIQVLAISGSTRQRSANHDLVGAIAGLATGIFTVNIFEGLTSIPHFNPDLDLENTEAPAAVADFREKLREADAVLICTPEYAIGVPGTLKNAIDWTVSSMSFSGKPVALITASTSGFKAHASLLGTLLIIESRISAATQLVIPAIRTRINGDGKITDAGTLDKVNLLITSLAGIVRGEEQEYLPAPTMN